MELADFISYIPAFLFTAFLILYWVMAFFLIYHLDRFGIGTQPKVASFLFLIGSVGITIAVIVLYNYIDFQMLLDKLNNFAQQ